MVVRFHSLNTDVNQLANNQKRVVKKQRPDTSMRKNIIFMQQEIDFDFH